MALTARTSLQLAAFAAFGVATADGLYALVATIGGSALAPLIEPITVPLKWDSVLVLLTLTTRGATMAITQHRRLRSSGSSATTPPPPARAYFALLGMTMLNRTTDIYFTALVLGSHDATTPAHLEQSAFVLAALAASTSWQLALATGGALLSRLLTTPTTRLLAALLSTLLITGLALHLLLTTL